MMIKRLFAAMGVCVLLTGAAWALPGPNSMGVFLDAAPTTGPLTVCHTKPVGNIEFYLCLMNPYVPSGATAQVAAWEVEIQIINKSLMFGSWDLLGGLDAGIDIDSETHYFAVGNGGSPLQPDANNVVTLAHYSGFLSSNAQPIVFILRGHPGTQSFPDTGRYGYAPNEDDLVEAITYTGDAYDPSFGAYISNPVLVINDDGTYCTNPVANEDMTWSTVKDLYR